MIHLEQTVNGLVYEDDGECYPAYGDHIGVDMFHAHLNALAAARTSNRIAGLKVKRVVVAKGHFMVVRT